MVCSKKKRKVDDENRAFNHKRTENIDNEHLDMCMRMNMRPIQSISKPLDKVGDWDKRGKESS